MQSIFDMFVNRHFVFDIVTRVNLFRKTVKIILRVVGGVGGSNHQRWNHYHILCPSEFFLETRFRCPLELSVVTAALL